MYGGRLTGALVVAGVLHVAVALLLARLPEQPRPPQRVTVEMRVVTPPPSQPEPPPQTPPPPEPTPEPEPIAQQQPQEQPTQPAPHTTKPQAMKVSARATGDHDTAPSERAVTVGDSTDTPQFGFSLESTSEAGKGPAMPVGNTLMAPGGGPRVDNPKPLAAAPVAARDVTKDPLPVGRCRGEYTPDAHDAGVEGVVILSLTVDADGNARDIKLVQKLGHGLDEAAMDALKRCKFSPGEHNGQKVAVRIPAFKLRFVLQESGD